MSQYRIDHSQARQHQGTPHADLDLVFGHAQDGVASDLGAGSRGSRNRNMWCGIQREWSAGTEDLQIILQLAAVGKHCRNDFAGIENAAAANADYEVAFGSTGRLHCRGCNSCGRLAGHVECHMVDSVFVESLKERRSPFGGTARDNESTFAHIAG